MVLSEKRKLQITLLALSIAAISALVGVVFTALNYIH